MYLDGYIYRSSTQEKINVRISHTKMLRKLVVFGKPNVLLKSQNPLAKKVGKILIACVQNLLFNYESHEVTHSSAISIIGLYNHQYYGNLFVQMVN